MAVDASSPDTSGTLDLNTLLKQAMAGGTMSNIFGGGQDGGQFIMGALLGRLLFNPNGLDGANANQNADRAAIDSAVSTALASSNQANNNSMILLKDIQDTGQDIVGAITASTTALSNSITSTAQTNLVQQLQNQIANLQGQSDIKLLLLLPQVL